MKHYRATELNGWLRKTGYVGLSSEGDWYFVQYRWPFGRWKSRFEQAPTAREEELRTKEAATSLAKARQARAIFWTTTGVALGWIALEAGLWWYSLQGAPWTTLGALGLGWAWMLEDWWHREGERLEALGEPPAPLAEEEAAQDEPVQQALDEVLRSTPMRENNFFHELLDGAAVTTPIIRAGASGSPPRQEYGFHSELLSADMPPVLSFGALPGGFGWRVNSTGSPQDRDDPVPDPRPAPPTGSSQGRNDPSQPLTMGRIHVDPVTGRLVFNNIHVDAVPSDVLDGMVRGNNAHIFTQCLFTGTADPRLDASRSSGMIRLSSSQPAPAPLTMPPALLPEPVTIEQLVASGRASQFLSSEDIQNLRSFNGELNRQLQAMKDPDPPPPPPPPPPPVSSLERRRRRVQRILQERGGPAPDED